MNEERELNTLIPSVVVDSNYNLLAMNATARSMFGEVLGDKCYKVLYGLEVPCYQKGIKCPVYDKVSDFDVINLDYETYLRGYGKIPMGGIYYESIVNITKVNYIRSSFIDPVSGLYNRKFAEGYLEKSYTLWKRYGQHFGIMLVDIDDLKNINDKYGHMMGDKAIERISTCLKIMVRSSDIVSRYGGDEFLIILPNTTLELSEHAAIRILKCVRQAQFIHPLSVSVGLTRYIDEDDSFKDAIKRADEAMYKAKLSGKGKIGIASSKDVFYLVEGGREYEKV
ncbi:MAG: GGDEF domain-containing protein [Acidobacteria bacterium]|nr:MAG: GGDEF domain-containing protein [Acidobacteriota bacterium]